MKIKFCLALLLVMVVFVANILPTIAYEGWTPPAIQSHETVGVGGSVEKTMIFYGTYDTLAVVEFTVERGKEVKVNYKLDSEKEGFGVRWSIYNEEGYESYINKGEWYASDQIDNGECIHTTKTLFIDEPDTYYFVIVAIVNELHSGEDWTPVIYYKIEVEDMTPTPAPTATPTPTPAPYAVHPTPTPTPFASIPPLYILSAAAIIVIILIAGIGITRKGKKGKSTKPQPPAEPPKPIIKKETPLPLFKSLTIERAIYDPCKRDFIERALPRMKEWINRYDPGAYWFALSIQNNTDKTIEEWGVELETSSALKVEKAIIEGIEYKTGLRETHPEPYKNVYVMGIPKEYGIVIPKGGAQRVYFKLHAEKPKTTYEISGVFKSAISGEVPIRAKEFKYLCDTGVSPEAVKAELKKTFSEKDAARLANTFRIVQEIRSSYCTTDTTASEISKEFDVLKMYLTEREFLDEIESIQRRINAELREDERLDEKHVEELKDFCEKFTEMWIARFLR